jgi:hypothetical protein
VRQSVSVIHSLLSQIPKRSHSPSAHTLAAKLWMITESDRSVAPLLLPDEY